MRPLTTSSLRASIARQVELELADLDAVMREAVLGEVVELAGVEQGLAGDAADVQAGAAEGRPLLDAGDFHAKLRRRGWRRRSRPGRRR